MVRQKQMWVPKSGQDDWSQPPAREQSKRTSGPRAGAHDSWRTSSATSDTAAGYPLSVHEVQQGLSSLLKQFHSKDAPAARAAPEPTPPPAKLQLESLMAAVPPGELLLRQLQGGAQNQQQTQQPQQQPARAVPAARGKQEPGIARQIKHRIFHRNLFLRVRQLEVQQRGPYHGPKWGVAPRPASDDAAEEDSVPPPAGQGVGAPLLADPMPVGLRLRMEAPVFEPGSAWVPATPEQSASVHADPYTPSLMSYTTTDAASRQPYTTSTPVYGTYEADSYGMVNQYYTTGSQYTTTGSQFPEVPTWPFGSQEAYTYNTSTQGSIMGTVPVENSSLQMTQMSTYRHSTAPPKLADMGSWDEDLESTTVSSGQLSAASQSPHLIGGSYVNFQIGT